jgi:hypothetical protein
LDNAVLGASSVTRRVRCLPARSVIDTEWEVSSEIVIAVARLAETSGTTNDDVGFQGGIGTISSIGFVCRADKFASGGVVDNLRAGSGSSSCEEESGVHHLGDSRPG